MRWSSKGPRRAGVGLGLIASLIFTARLAHAAGAAPERVILLEPADASPAAAQSLQRIKEELAADRFDVIFATSDTAAELASPTWSRESGALIALLGDPKTGRAELCVVSLTNKRIAVRRAVVVDTPDEMPEALASRALELLHATALELSVDARKTTALPASRHATTNGRLPAAANIAESTPFRADSGSS